jgi:hypothetical protein
VVSSKGKAIRQVVWSNLITAKVSYKLDDGKLILLERQTATIQPQFP